MSSKNRVSVNLSKDEYIELAALAEASEVSISWIGRQAIIKFLDRHKQRELQLPLIGKSSSHKVVSR